MTMRFAEWLVRHRAIGWLAISAVSAASFFGLSKLRFDDDLRNVFRSSEVGAVSRFSLPENSFLVLLRGDRLFEPEVAGRIREFDFALREIEGIASVTSLFDIRSLRATDGYRPPLMPGAGGSDSDYAKAAEEARRHPMVNGILLGQSGRSLLFFADPSPELDQVRELIPLQRQIADAAESLANSTGMEVHLAGFPALRNRIVSTTQRELVLFSLGGIVVGAAVSWLFFRRLSALLVTLPVPFFASAWTLGAMGLAGEPVNPMNQMISVFVMIIALTDAVHLIFAIRRNLGAGLPPAEASKAGLIEVGPACFLTSLTTAIAFASLAFSSNEIVVRFGITCAIGTMLVFATVVVLVPLLSATALGLHLGSSSPRSEARVRRIFAGLARFVETARWPIAIVGSITALGAALLCLRIESDYRYRENLDPAAPEWIAIETIDDEFGGSQPLYLVVEPIRPDSPPSDFRPLLEELSNRVESIAGTGRPLSLLNLLGAFRIEGGNPVAALAAELPAESLAAFLDPSSRATLVAVALPDDGSRRLSVVLDRIEEETAELRVSHPDFRIRPVGLVSDSIRSSRTMIDEMGIGLFSAAVLIFLVIGLFLRSADLGLRSILPNLLPIFLVGAGLALFGKPLQYVSAMALTICLGVAVDDTIHFLHVFRENRRRGLATSEAVHETLVTAGSAMCVSTFVLLAGFGLLLASELPTVRLLGWLGIGTLSVALVADLVLMPALLMIAGTSGNPGKATPKPNEEDSGGD